MQIIQTHDFEALAHLNKDVHDVHFNLYPEYFKEYDFESMKEFFKRIIDHPHFIFLLLEDDISARQSRSVNESEPLC